MKKDIGSQTHFDSPWWKKHKAMTVKDKGLFAALVAYEKATKDFGEETLTHDFYAQAVAAVDAVGVAAKATLDGIGKAADTVAKGTRNHLEAYPAEIVKYKGHFDRWKAKYDQELKRLKDRYTNLLGEIRTSELESQQAEKELKTLKAAIEEALKGGPLDAQAKSSLGGKVNGLKSTFADLQNVAAQAEKTAKDLDLNLPPAFNKDTNSKLGALTHDSINKVLASIKISDLTLGKLAQLVG